MNVNELAGDIPLEGYFPGHLTAGTAKECAIFRAPFRGVITAVEFIAAAAVAGAVTNNFTLNLRNRTTAGVGTAVPATLNFTNGVNAVAQAPTSLTLSATAADLAVAKGDVLTLEKAIVGTGLACPDGCVVIHFKSA